MRAFVSRLWASPKCLELRLGLGHVGVHEGEVPESLDAIARVHVDRVEALVHLELPVDVDPDI